MSGVSNEAAIGLVNELATRLSGIVEEFGRRTDSLVAASRETDVPDEETLIRIVKAEPGGLDGKGIWLPATSGYSPGEKTEQNERYLQGTYVTVQG